ncbi:MAG: hypothetical protein ACFE7E_09095 [Candidatus Hodarchaeota archaeon]
MKEEDCLGDYIREAFNFLSLSVVGNDYDNDLNGFDDIANRLVGLKGLREFSLPDSFGIPPHPQLYNIG